MDTHVANTLIQAARLLATHVILTGIRAGVARSLDGLGAELGNVTSRSVLREGIACAPEYLRRLATNL